MEINRVGNRVGVYQQNTQSKKQKPSFGIIAINPDKFESSAFKRKLTEIATKNDAYRFGLDEMGKKIMLIITEHKSGLEKKILKKFSRELRRTGDVSTISEKKTIEYIKRDNEKPYYIGFKESEKINYLDSDHFVDAFLS